VKFWKNFVVSHPMNFLTKNFAKNGKYTLFKTNKIARCCCIHGSRVGRKKCRGYLFYPFIFFYSQIWLNHLMDGLHLGYIRKLKKKKKKKKKKKTQNPKQLFSSQWLCKSKLVN